MKKKRWIITGNKLGWLLMDSPSYNKTKFFSSAVLEETDVEVLS